MTSQPNQSLIDGLACLQALSISGMPVGNRELARSLQLNPMRVNRLLRTLADLGLARQDDKKKYHTGPALQILATQSLNASGLIKKALPRLRQLGQPGHLIALGVLWRNKVSYLYHGEHGSPYEEALGKTALHEASKSSIGLALLAQNMESLDQHYPINTEIPDFPDREILISSLQKILQQGYATVHHPQPNEHISLAVAIDASSAVAITHIPVETQLDPLIEDLHSFVKHFQQGTLT